MVGIWWLHDKGMYKAHKQGKEYKRILQKISLIYYIGISLIKTDRYWKQIKYKHRN